MPPCHGRPLRPRVSTVRRDRIADLPGDAQSYQPPRPRTHGQKSRSCRRLQHPTPTVADTGRHRMLYGCPQSGAYVERSRQHLFKDDLEHYVQAILVAAGVSGPMAAEWARVLVWANLRSTDSQRGDGIKQEREISGIPIPQGTWNRLCTAVAGIGVPPPETVFRFVGIGTRSRFLCVIAFSDGEPFPLRRKTLQRSPARGRPHCREQARRDLGSPLVLQETLADLDSFSHLACDQ